MSAVFDRLGFARVAVVSKTRSTFTSLRDGREMRVTIDRAGDLGIFAEVEAVSEDRSDLPSAQAAVMRCAETLGLSEVEPRSYLRMTLERQRGDGIP